MDYLMKKNHLMMMMLMMMVMMIVMMMVMMIVMMMVMMMKIHLIIMDHLMMKGFQKEPHLLKSKLHLKIMKII
jgi:hypothetical protein